MEEYDVAVIGAGPAGSMAAKRASQNGAEVLLLEEHSSVGWPVQCAGLLGVKAIEESELGLGSFVIRSIHGADIHSPSGHILSFCTKETKAWVVERRLFDQALLTETARQGVDFRIGSPVTRLVRNRGESVLTIGHGADSWNVKAKVVISAEGVSARIARSAGIEPPRKILSSAQVEVPFKVEDPDKVEVHLGKGAAPGFFAWVIPSRNGAARVGLSCREGAYEQLKKFLRSDPLRPRLQGGFLDLVVGGLPLGPPKSVVTEGLIAVGDAAGQVKPTSGGGIYPGLICAKIAGEVAASAAQEGDASAFRLQEYEKRWRKVLGRELSLGMRVHEMVAKMDDKDLGELIRHLNDNQNLIEIIEKYGDVDRPSVAIKKIAPRLGLSGLRIARMFWRH